MKWKVKKPVAGAIRERRRFAWLPEIVGEYRIWLETYSVTEQLRLVDVTLSVYKVLRWVEINRQPLFVACA